MVEVPRLLCVLNNAANLTFILDAFTFNCLTNALKVHQKNVRISKKYPTSLKEA